MSGPLRVLIAEDHDVVRAGIRLVLESESDLRIVAEARTAPDAIASAVQSQPDVVIMDVRLGSGSGIQATREIQSRIPASNVLMLTSYPDDDALFASIMAGASGYMLKSATPAELIRAVRRVGLGESLLDPSVTRPGLTPVRQSPVLGRDEKLSRLTRREAEGPPFLAPGKTKGPIPPGIPHPGKTVKNQWAPTPGKH